MNTVMGALDRWVNSDTGHGVTVQELTIIVDECQMPLIDRIAISTKQQ
jgi:hypothetical protein